MHSCCYSDAGTGGSRGATGPPPIFGRAVNPIPTGEGRLSQPITTGTPNINESLVLLLDITNTCFGPSIEGQGKKSATFLVEILQES